MLNSSVNFDIYCRLSKEFQTVFNKVFVWNNLIAKEVNNPWDNVKNRGLREFNILSHQVTYIE